MNVKLNRKLDEVRFLILCLAQENDAVGSIEESIKWGQQSFAAKAPKSGTPIRIAGNAEHSTYSLYVPCSTSIIPDFRETHPDMFNYHGNREIRLDLNTPLPRAELSLFITAALTYYLD